MGRKEELEGSCRFFTLQATLKEKMKCGSSFSDTWLAYGRSRGNYGQLLSL